MDFLTIQCLMGKLQAHEERVNEIQQDIGAQVLFQNKMVLDISNGVEDMDKAKEEEERQIWKRKSCQP